MKRYKFLRVGMKSEKGNMVWRIGQWKKFDDKLEMCKFGFHCSKEPYDAFSFVQGEWLAVVEVRGESIKEKNKEVWSEMRIIEKYKWKKKDSVRLAIFSAEQVLGIFEKEHPDDKRPREAIEAAKRYLKKPSKVAVHEATNAAQAAYAAAHVAADAAVEATNAAVEAAYTAAYAANAVTYAANTAANTAVEAANAAEATDVTIIKKIQNYFKKIVKEKQNAIGCKKVRSNINK